jgi:hypothetical protein
MSARPLTDIYPVFRALLRLLKPHTLLHLATLAIVGFAGYHVAQQWVAAEVYRQRLRELSDRYEGLRATYNDAVRRTAVTELLVKDGELSVVVRNAAGVVQTIPTPFRPAEHEVHVDFVVLEGRLWIRRIMRVAPPRAEQVLIDPRLAQIDWDDRGENYGITIYRSLTEGRWVVNTTANGALTLVKQPSEAPAPLASAPEVRQFEQLQAEARRELDSIGLAELLRRVTGALSPGSRSEPTPGKPEPVTPVTD